MGAEFKEMDKCKSDLERDLLSWQLAAGSWQPTAQGRAI